MSTGDDADQTPETTTAAAEAASGTSATGDAVETVETVETEAGAARVTWRRAKRARLVLAVSHGAGGGIEARDLQALARLLPAHGVTVALV
ncbi:hydrolase, partial [Streptomyces sp. SID9944]|nr:hydrolase [Streptomyces sp. SID9944]